MRFFFGGREKTIWVATKKKRRKKNEKAWWLAESDERTPKKANKNKLKATPERKKNMTHNTNDFF